MPVAIALNIEPKGQRQDQDQGLKYYKLVKMGYDWQFRNSHRAGMSQGQSCVGGPA